MEVPVLSAGEWRKSPMSRRRFTVPTLSAERLKPLEQLLGVAHADQQVDTLVQLAVRQVGVGGDDVVRRYTAALDGVTLGAFELTAADVDRAAAELEEDDRQALEQAAERIRAFHRLQLPNELGAGELRLLPEPLRRTVAYIPGGRACYPSTVLMNAIPARLAGVGEVIITSPPRSDGSLPAAVLYASRLAGVDRVFRLGGPQAIAAFAYGTESVPAVDKITGPGNIFVTLAKRAVYGAVGIDGLAGPSEILVIADDSADPAQVIADLASQLEHDPEAWAVLLTTSQRLAKEVAGGLAGDELAARFGNQAAELHAAVVVVPDLAAALSLAEDFAPEHMELLVEDVDAWLPRVRRAGMVFAGHFSPVPMGDYVAGTNHTLPTGGAARFAMPLGVYDFYRWTAVVHLGPETAAAIAPVGIRLAQMEGLVAHKRSLERLLQRSQGASSEVRT